MERKPDWKDIADWEAPIPPMPPPEPPPPRSAAVVGWLMMIALAPIALVFEIIEAISRFKESWSRRR